MYKGKSILAIIPARGGSKGVLRKNIRETAGKPLIAWTIEEARKSKYIDRIILSSDDEEIIKVAQSYGCQVPFKRPLELAQYDTPGIEVVLHAINTLQEQYDYIVLLQPTSPLRLAEDIDGCINLCLQHQAPACVTVTEPDKSPYWMYIVDEQGTLQPLIKLDQPITCRQDLPQAYALNGAVYVAERNWLLRVQTFLTNETLAYVMPRERSLDVDSEFDLKLCCWLLK